MRHFPLFSVILMCGALSAGCAGTSTSDTGPTHTGFLSDYAKLEPDTADPGARIYLKAGVDWKKYDKVMLDRIQVWLKDDADYKGIDPTQLKALTDYFQQARPNRHRSRIPRQPKQPSAGGLRGPGDRQEIRHQSESGRGLSGGERRFVLHQCLQYLGLRRSRVRRLGWPIAQATRRSARADGTGQLKTTWSSLQPCPSFGILRLEGVCLLMATRQHRHENKPALFIEANAAGGWLP